MIVGKMKKVILLLLLILAFLGPWMLSFAAQRFPMPEFESAYTHPETLTPAGRSEYLQIVDVMVLLAALSVVSWLVIKKRSRKGVFAASLFSLLYFGFYREGCVCSIGAIQNVTLALFNSGYTISVSALLFFLLPLFFTLFFGRTFCAGVCPFGALQDLVAFRPQKLGTALKSILGLIPFLYLGFAVLYAATGTDFIICRYDPFVGFFRFNASFGMFVFGGTLLLSGVFIARPYCRFLCPYGVILNWVSRIAVKHITVTPTICIQCRLCENSCPYEAIDFPVIIKNPVPKKRMMRKFMISLLLIPVLIISIGYLGSRMNERFALVHPRVALARDIMDPLKLNAKVESQSIKAYKSSGKPASELYAEVTVILGKFRTGGWILGGFIGLVIGMMISGKLIHRYNPDYVPNKGTCFSCARCVDYCPVKS